MLHRRSIERRFGLKKDTKSRKYLLTINNPKENGFSCEHLQQIITDNFKSILYYCLADDVGGNEGTYHTNVFLQFSSPVRFSQIKKYFPTAHIDRSRGTSRQNKEYVFKQGRWSNMSKSVTHLPETRFEWGELPEERPGNRSDLHELYTQIKDGLTNAEILEHSSNNLLLLNHIDKVRKTVLEAKYRDTWRDLTVAYISGKTGVGKTRGILEHFGYQNVYRITNYKNPFDSYNQQSVILFDEYHSQLKIDEMLNYLDGYPLELPCRYNNKVACFTKVFIVSNISITDQYKEIQHSNNRVWKAFLRRFHGIFEIVNRELCYTYDYITKSPPNQHIRKQIESQYTFDHLANDIEFNTGFNEELKTT